MSERSESTPASVPEGAQQAGDAHDVLSTWSWTERCVWTERMLTALDTNNVKGGKNAYFAECGLFSMRTAYTTASQSARR